MVKASPTRENAMADIIINSYFTQPNGFPALGLSPTIRIWEVNEAGQDLIIGSPIGTNDPGPPGGSTIPGPGAGNDGVLLEITDGSEQDGFYKYTFDQVNGLDITKTYLARVDAGPTLPVPLRFQIVRFDPSNFVDLETIPQAVWGADPTDYPAGTTTMGGVVNQTYDFSFDSNQVINEIKTVDLPAILALLDIVRKYDTNRTRIDPVTHTLTIFDDDCITPLRVFKLLDHEGDPTVTNVCERNPQNSLGTTDGFPTCS